MRSTNVCYVYLTHVMFSSSRAHKQASEQLVANYSTSSFVSARTGARSLGWANFFSGVPHMILERAEGWASNFHNFQPLFHHPVSVK